MADAQSRIVLPEHCVVAIGLPSTREGFIRSAETSSEAYVHQYLGGWEQYSAQWLLPLQNFIGKCETFGATVLNEATFESMKSCFRHPGLSAFVLMSHWGDSGIECADRFASIQQFVGMVPDKFEGVVDLCVCHPEGLASELLRERPNCLVRFTPKKVSPLWWLLYFEGLFRILSNGKLSYIQAYEQLNLELARKVMGNGI